MTGQTDKEARSRLIGHKLADYGLEQTGDVSATAERKYLDTAAAEEHVGFVHLPQACHGKEAHSVSINCTHTLCKQNLTEMAADHYHC